MGTLGAEPSPWNGKGLGHWLYTAGLGTVGGVTPWTKAQGGDVTGPGRSASAMQQGSPGKGTRGPERHSQTLPHVCHE